MIYVEYKTTTTTKLQINFVMSYTPMEIINTLKTHEEENHLKHP